MLVEEKYFKSDKNYLLKNVQAFSKDYLLEQWTEVAFEYYNKQHNPMGLIDDFIIELRAKLIKSTILLDGPYDILAASYRLLYGDNQLTFNWDGRSHMEIYDEEWKEKYFEWIKVLSNQNDIQRSIIKYAITQEGINTTFLSQCIKRGILGYFNLRLRSKTLYKVSA